MTEKTVLCQEQSLLCENGKNERKPQELTAKQCKEGFSKTRDPQHPGAKRQEEYFTSKCELIKKMVKRAIANPMPFECVLTGGQLVHNHLTCKICLPLKEEVPSLGNGQDGKHEIWYAVGRTDN